MPRCVRGVNIACTRLGADSQHCQSNAGSDFYNPNVRTMRSIPRRPRSLLDFLRLWASSALRLPTTSSASLRISSGQVNLSERPRRGRDRRHGSRGAFSDLIQAGVFRSRRPFDQPSLHQHVRSYGRLGAYLHQRQLSQGRRLHQCQPLCQSRGRSPESGLSGPFRLVSSASIAISANRRSTSRLA